MGEKSEVKPNPIIVYYELMSREWPKNITETKAGRRDLRSFVAKLRSTHETALALGRGDLSTLDVRVLVEWNYQMMPLFDSLHYSETSEARRLRDELLASCMPFELKTQDSYIPHNPLINDPSFFERLFELRVCHKSFNHDDNESLRLVYEKYKQLWMMKYLRQCRPLLTGGIYLWKQLILERLVSIVMEWEIHGIKTDEDDVWDEAIPEDVVPADVQNSFENDDLYQKRMFHHDMAKDSLLFYGLPIAGPRLPNLVPEVQVDYEQAKKELDEAVEKLDKDFFINDVGMEKLAKVANQFLRARAAART